MSNGVVPLIAIPLDPLVFVYTNSPFKWVKEALEGNRIIVKVRV